MNKTFVSFFENCCPSNCVDWFVINVIKRKVYFFFAFVDEQVKLFYGGFYWSGIGKEVLRVAFDGWCCFFFYHVIWVLVRQLQNDFNVNQFVLNILQPGGRTIWQLLNEPSSFPHLFAPLFFNSCGIFLFLHWDVGLTAVSYDLNEATQHLIGA